MLPLILLIILTLIVQINTQHIWHSYQHKSFHQNREELLITNVKHDENFKLNYEINKWKSLQLRNSSYAVGFNKNQIVSVVFKLNSKGNRFEFQSSPLELNCEAVDVSLFSYWNKNKKKNDLITVIATNELELLWYRVEEINLVPFWKWQINKNITHLNHFEINYDHQLLIITDYRNQFSLDLYEFELNKPNFWLRQTISLNNSSKSSAFNYFNDNHFLSILQNHNLFIYKLTANGFDLYKNITSSDLNEVVPFNLGSKSFLAFNGLRTGIYKFTKTGLMRQTVVNSNLIGIIYWLPIPFNHHRGEELILLAQRRLVHGEHKSFVIELITYNGRQFEEHEDIPCYYFGENTDNLQCLIEEDSLNGIIDGVPIAFGRTLALLVPRKNRFSELFIMETTIRKIPSPVENEIKDLLERKTYLEKLLIAQEKKFDKIRASLESELEDETELLENLTQKPKILSLPAEEGNKLLNFSAFSSNNEEITLKPEIFPINPEILPIEPGKETLPFKEPKDGEIDLDRINQQLDNYGREIALMKAKFDVIEDMESKTHYDTIIINGIVEIEDMIEAEEVETQQIAGESANELLNDLVLKDHLQFIPSPKIFTNLEVEDLSFLQVNNISASDLIFESPNGSISINTDLVVEETLQISGDVICDLVNGYKLENEIVNFNDRFINLKNLHFDQILIEVGGNLEIKQLNDLSFAPKPLVDIRMDERNLEIPDTLELDTAYISNNITAKNLNGEDFDQLIKQLCLINIVCYLPGEVKISNGLYVNRNVDIKYLNGLPYPQNYFFQSQNSHLVVTGEKIFEGLLQTRGLFAFGLINGMNVTEMVTLSTEQEIPGKIRIENLEVRENISVLGEVIGEFVDQLIPNKPLSVENLIRSNVYFTTLEVEGDIILSNNFGKDNFEELLSNIVYTDEENPVIQSLKEFPAGFTIETDLALESNAVDVIPLDLFLTKNTDQVINGHSINGDVVFQNLQLKGLYDGVDIKNFDQVLIKLSGQQYISSEIIFDEIEVEDLEIVHSLNDLSSEEYLFENGDRQMTHVLEFEAIIVENLFIEQNLSVVNFTNFDLADFEANRLSFSRDQEIECMYIIGSSEINYIKPELIEGIPYEELFDYGRFLGKVSEDLAAGKLKLKNLHVNGSLQIEDPQIKNLGIFRNSFKNFNLEIMGTATFESLQITYLSNANFDYFVKNIIFQNETNLNIFDTKIFQNGFSVEKLIETKLLNNVPIENILTKQGLQEISGPITVYGDVIFTGELNITGDINTYPISYFLENLEITDDGSYKIKGEMLFNRMTFVENLQIQGFVNGRNAQNHLDSLVYGTEDIKISGQIVFRNQVEIKKNLDINNTLDGINLFEFASNVAKITKDSEINGLVVFTKPVTVQKDLVVANNIITGELDGVDLNDWKNEAVFIDRGFLAGDYFFEDMVINDQLYTQFVNDINISNLIPLRTNQSLDQLEFEQLMPVKDVYVGQAVNGLNLTQEFSNTLMNGLDQEITSNLTFTGRIFVQNLTIEGHLNGKNFQRLVTTNTNQALTAMYNFTSKTILENDLLVTGLVNGVYLTDWFKRSLNLSDPQNVTEDWIIDGSLIFKENVDGNGTINGLDLKELKHQIEEKRHFKYSIERTLIDNYINLCKDVDYLYERAAAQIYKFHYLEILQYVDFPDNVQNFHHLQNGQNFDYLLINAKGNCMVHLLVFNGSLFVPLFNVEMGVILQVINVNLGNRTILVARNQKESCLEGTNIWEFEDNRFKLLASLETLDLLQDSSIPGTFYGLDQFGVTEFQLTFNNKFSWKKHNQWKIQDDNLAFVPRGLGTGLALRSGTQLIHLIRHLKTHDKDADKEDDFGVETQEVHQGHIIRLPNDYLPGQNGGDLVVLKVGTHKQSLLAVASHEETSVKGRLDFIKIYEDINNGRLLHKVLTTKPSSLVSIEFNNNGETLLVFLEDQKTLQVYEYKGIEGFKHRMSAKLEGSQLFSLSLQSRQKMLGLIDKNRVTIIEAEMLGHQIRENLKCLL